MSFYTIPSGLHLLCEFKFKDRDNQVSYISVFHYITTSLDFYTTVTSLVTSFTLQTLIAFISA